MATKTVDSLVGILQVVAAGADFDEQAPEDSGGVLSPTFEDAVFKFSAADVHAGLFDPRNGPYTFRSTDALDIFGIEIKLGGQTAWAVNKSDVEGNTVTLYSGTTETFFVMPILERFPLLPGETIKITTTGASTAMSALLKVEPHVPSRRI